ncbi:PDZ domain-containing protein [Streptomyces sp. NPDC085931]|uniref:PDZ domain-containing protein n=1 Tax=Streptomyces sp. NPDC085931 TaxID=3365740 RepID=UPI0037CE8B23
MERTALRPKPMPGQEPEPSPATASGPPRRRPHAARRRGRRLLNVLLAGFVGAVLVLSGIGLGAMGATVAGQSGVLDPRGRHTPPPARPSPATAASAHAPAVTLGVQVMDARRPGAVVVGLHVPGPAQQAGLVRGDVLLNFGPTRIDTAADLVRAVARARPGREVTLTVRHRGGGYEQVTVVPALVT